MKLHLKHENSIRKVYFVDGQTFVMFPDGAVRGRNSRSVALFVTIEAFVRHWRTA